MSTASNSDAERRVKVATLAAATWLATLCVAAIYAEKSPVPEAAAAVYQIRYTK